MTHTYLNNAEHAFYSVDGKPINNIRELAWALEEMNDGSYTHHAKGNDFSKWVENCIGDEHLAKKLAGAENRSAARHIVTQRVLQLAHFPTTTNQAKDASVQETKTDEPSSAEEQAADDNLQETIKDIELLSSSISTESFLKTYWENDYAGQPRIVDNVKESEAALELFSTKKSNEQQFLSGLARLMNLIELNDGKASRRLYTELKTDFDASNYANKRKIHGVLLSCYEKIKNIE